MTVAALYVDPKRGPYAEFAQFDVWGPERDARKYDGPGPVIAHPPCASWGRFAWRASKQFHDCGPRAVAQVRQFGGVLEHPVGSLLWKECGLPRPGEPADAFGGVCIVVRQCDWGHMAEKRTWLYVVGFQGDLDSIPRPPRAEPTHCVEPHASGKRAGGVRHALPRMPKSQRHVTPWRFAMWLARLARRCQAPGQR